MKKGSLLLLLPLLASMALTSCDNGTKKPSSKLNVEDYVPVITEPTKITLWSITGQNNQPQLTRYVEEFMQYERNVTVENIYQSGMGYNELKTAVVNNFTSGSYPDIVQCYPDHVAEYISYNKAVNLQPYMDHEDPSIGLGDEKDDYITNFMQEGMEYAVEGVYSVPYCKSTELMFYNEDVLKGLNLAQYDKTINNGKPLNQKYFDNLTWEELFGKLCPALVAYNDAQDDDNKILLSDKDYHAVFAYDSDDNLFITLAEQYGYGYTSLNKETGKGSIDFVNDGMKNLMKTFREAAEKGYIISKGSAGNAYTNEFFTARNTLFSVGSTGGVKYQFDASNPMNVGVARIPHAAGKDPKVISQGPSLTILDHQDENRRLASWLLWKFITNSENSLDWAINSGYSGVRYSNYESDEYKEYFSLDGKQEKTIDRLMALANQKAEEVLDETYISPAFKGSSEARTQAGGLMTKVLTPSSGDVSNFDTWFEDAKNNTLLTM